MAETVYLADGSMEVCLTDKQTFFERLIRERLGDDAARFFTGLIAGLNEEIADHLRSVREQEMSVDGYSALCYDAKDQFEYIRSLLNAPRLDRAKLQAAAEQGYNDLYKNL